MEATPATRVTTPTVIAFLRTPGEPRLTPVRVHATWDSRDPLAVDLCLIGPDETDLEHPKVNRYLHWSFARDLLIACSADGAVSGEGDVRFKRGACRTTVTLGLAGDLRALAVDNTWVDRFLARTLSAVPAGSEPSAFDADDDRWAAELALLTSDRN